METKQFPEKWAVRADGKDLTEELSRFNEDDKWVLNNKDVKGITYFLYDGSYLDWGDKLSDGYTEVTLEDLIAHYEPKPKWMPLTSKQEVIEEIIEFHNHYIVKIQTLGVPMVCNNKGISEWRGIGNLIPYNPRIAELEEKIESKRSELAELEGELEELKK